MDLLVRTVARAEDDRRAVGHSEAIPRWGMGARAALGVLSVIALLIPIALLSAVVLTPGSATGDVQALGGAFGMFIFHGLLVLFFVSFVRQNPRIGGERGLWIAGLLFAAPITLPIYWWMHVWNAPWVGPSHVDNEVPPRVAGDLA